MRSWTIRGFLVVAMLVGLASSGHAQNRERQQILAEVRILHEQTMRLQLSIAALSDSLDAISQRLDEQADEAITALADQQLLVNAVAEDVHVIREKLDDTNVRISSMSQEVEALRVAIPLVPFGAPAVDPDTGLPLAPSPDAAYPTAAPPSPVVNPGVSPQRMYDTAWADYTNGQWELAIEGFQAYLDTFPRSELADDAQFYIGQTHYAVGEFEDAVEAFDRVIAGYPGGDAVPEASYKKGLALDRLGDAEGARQAFELVIENHPESTMATLARQALERLRQP